MQRISVSLDDVTYATLKAQAAREGRAVSSLARWYLFLAIEGNIKLKYTGGVDA